MSVINGFVAATLRSWGWLLTFSKQLVCRVFSLQNAGCLQSPGKISQHKMNPIHQQVSLPDLSQASELSQNIHRTEHLWQEIFVEICLSGWICLGFPAVHIDCITDAAILTAAAMLKAGRTPRLHRAARCQLQSFLPPCSALTASSTTHTCNCSWAREHISSENN